PSSFNFCSHLYRLQCCCHRGLQFLNINHYPTLPTMCYPARRYVTKKQAAHFCAACGVVNQSTYYESSINNLGFAWLFFQVLSTVYRLRGYYPKSSAE